MIPSIPFGRTGHASTRLLFGAAALWRSTQAEADAALDQLLAAGVNHIDTAASYGDSELRVGPWLARHRDRFFLATKTGERSYAAARDQIRASLERLQTDRIDLLQLHNLVKPDEWEQAMGPDGALRAAVEARDAGRVRFLGVTGHGTKVAAMHAKSLERFDFDSVLLPLNPAMLRDARYRDELESLLALCRRRNVAVQTNKSVARRRWTDGTQPTHDTWYEPLTDPADVERAVHWALAQHPDVFVNTAGDLRLLAPMIRAAESFASKPRDGEIAAVEAKTALEPLFVRGFAGA
jgi:aryl-alcohol dehydrogenase-like predicted oxidoreductase